MGRGFKSLTAHDPIFAGVAELADALDLGSSVFGRVGSSPTTRIANHILTIYADLAQLVEHLSCKQGVEGSSPLIGIKIE